ncbi:MAG: hypothetical protein IV100_02090 [Myxococcales bacterium]|nr:hypothetical protein [Myxococcales bacterium]
MRALKLSAAFLVVAIAAISLGTALTRTPPDDALFPRVTAKSPATLQDGTVSLLDRLPEARVAWGDHSGRYTGVRWVSGLEDWLWVGPHAGLVTTDRGPEWRWCLWSHLPKGSAVPTPLTITFPVPAGVGRLHGEAAVLDTPRDGADVNFEVSAGEKRIAHTLRDARGENRWLPYELLVPGEATELRFRLTATNADWRHVCFTAFLSPLRTDGGAP